MDITYIPTARGSVYLAAVPDWGHPPGAVMTAVDHHGSCVLHRNIAGCFGTSLKSLGGLLAVINHPNETANKLDYLGVAILFQTVGG